ncbi:hypothetical protein ACLOJK_006744, partial [Asimina triloba]
MPTCNAQRRLARPLPTARHLTHRQCGISVSHPHQATATADIVGIEDVVAATVHHLL